MLGNKKGASFGTIVAVFGSVLIALGVAWLIAQNWHQIPSALKIIILLGATSASYIVGTVFRTKGYAGIGKSLLVLGALLYTLSIFLIAQIFSTSTSWQGTAFLLLLSWVGVFVSAYIFDSSASLVVALLEFVVWLVIQFIAFSESGRFEASFGILALCFLATGALIYGLGLLHRAKEHKFGRVYQWWSAFYFLIFAYILSFQSLLPNLWLGGLTFSSLIIFLLILAGISIVILVIGIMASFTTNAVHKKEIAGVFALIVFLAALIGSTGLVSGTIGACSQKQCYDIKDQASCMNSQFSTKCEWVNNYCTTFYKDCFQYKDKNFCTQESCEWAETTRCEQKDCERYTQSECEGIGNCKWQGTYCTEKEACSQINTQNECETNEKLSCEWLDNRCSPIQQNCYNYRTKNSCEKVDCAWVQSGECSGRDVYNRIGKAQCYTYNDASNCEAAKGCEWKSTYCDVERPCEKYVNNRKSCMQQAECNWRAGYYYSWWGGNNKTPLNLWVMWTFANVILLLLILGVIGYGTWQKLPKIINLGIVFFALDIITRYIGFVMDFWGYTSLSVIFIIGGILLLVAGWFIEKWRRKLIATAKEETSQTTTMSRR